MCLATQTIFLWDHGRPHHSHDGCVGGSDPGWGKGIDLMEVGGSDLEARH